MKNAKSDKINYILSKVFRTELYTEYSIFNKILTLKKGCKKLQPFHFLYEVNINQYIQILCMELMLLEF